MYYFLKSTVKLPENSCIAKEFYIDNLNTMVKIKIKIKITSYYILISIFSYERLV